MAATQFSLLNSHRVQSKFFLPAIAYGPSTLGANHQLLRYRDQI